MEVKIREMIGVRCITRDDGQRVYDTIHSTLKDGQSVTLDFDGVTQFASPFFNFAIGQLLKEITVDNLEDLVKIVNLVPDGRLVVGRVIENASRYHMDLDYRKIVDAILKQESEEAG